MLSKRSNNIKILLGVRKAEKICLVNQIFFPFSKWGSGQVPGEISKALESKKK